MVTTSLGVMSMAEVHVVARRRRQAADEIKSLLVEYLGLHIDPRYIGNDEPLFGTRLDLDSLDMLELAMLFEFASVTGEGEPAVGLLTYATVNSMVDLVLSNGLSLVGGGKT